MKATVLTPQMRRWLAPFACVLTLAAAIVYLSTLQAKANAPAGQVIDFTDYRGGPIDQWLATKGFRFERDAKSASKIFLRANENGLEVLALQKAQGLLINNAITQQPFSAVEIEWGIGQHPQGASYEKQVNNEAIMVHVFFGQEKKSSGAAFVPDLPYFIGLFLCNGDRVGVPYIGRYYQEGGRYVCLQSPPAGQTVVSRFNLQQGFQAIFGAAEKAISGVSVEVDTTASGGGGRSSAFIRRIRFLN